MSAQISADRCESPRISGDFRSTSERPVEVVERVVPRAGEDGGHVAVEGGGDRGAQLATYVDRERQQREPEGLRDLLSLTAGRTPRMRRWRTRGGRLRVLARRWRPDSNPLRRTADRVEAAVMVLLIATFLTGAPLAALTAGQAAAASGLRAQHAQAGWHRVTAVLLRKAPSSVNPMFEVALRPLVPARWTAPDGAKASRA